MISRH